MNFGGEIEDSRSSVRLSTVENLPKWGKFTKNSGKEMGKSKKRASVSLTKFAWN